MVFVGMAIGLSLIVIGNLVLNAVERHFAEQDAGELLAAQGRADLAHQHQADAGHRLSAPHNHSHPW